MKRAIAEPMGWRTTRTQLPLLALVLITGLAYLPATRNGFVWEADKHVTQDRNPRAWQDLASIWLDLRATPQYYPLVHTTFWFENQLWGRNPLGYHVVNLFLHGLTAALLWLILRRIGVPGAWAAAAVFAVHPMHVESVAWIVERKNVLSGTLAAASLWASLRFYRIGEPSANTDEPCDPPHRLSWQWYGWSLLLFVAALLSKTVVATLPAVMLLILWWKHGRLRRETISPLIPYFVLGIGLGSLTAYLETHKVGAVGQDWDLLLIERFLIAGRAVWFYAAKLLWPHPLMFIYPRWTIDPASPGQYIFPIAALAVPLILFGFRHRLGRGPLVAVLIFGGMLMPALGFFDVYPMRFSFVADHFAYLPSFALTALISAAVAVWLRNLRPGTRRPLQGAATGALLFVLATTTAVRCGAFRDAETLWSDTLRKNPNCMIACFNLAAIRRTEGSYSQADRYLRQAIDARPDHPLPYKNLALLQEQLGQIDDAIENLRLSIGLYRGYEPERGVAHLDLGKLLANREMLDEAIVQFRQALRCRPRDNHALEGLARSQAKLGRFTEAVPIYLQLVQAEPFNGKAYYNLGLAYERTGRLADAMDSYQQAILLDPNHLATRNNLGGLLSRLGQPQKAIAQFEAALNLEPDNTAANLNLGLAKAKLGALDQAIACVERARALEPNAPNILRTLAWLLTGNPHASPAQRSAAIVHATQACQLTDQQDPIALHTLAAALAAANRTDEAVEVATRAKIIAAAQGRADLAQQISLAIAEWQRD